MTETNYVALAEHTERVGNITFVVSSFYGEGADKTAEQFVLQLLENKITNGNYEMEVSA